jgi:hypothetical protein
LTPGNIDVRLLAGIAAAIVAGAIMVAYRFFRKPADPDEEERVRRAQLNQIGRIVEGLVVEIVEAPAPNVESGLAPKRKSTGIAINGDSGRLLVRYSYSISGVSYETAQDVTGLEDRLGVDRIAAGQSASVKYDPANPTNSILVSDDWSGIH